MEPKTTIIHHPEYGRVEGVTRSHTYEPWWKDERGGRMYYFESKGWKEVLPKRDVTGEVELGRNHTGWTTFTLGRENVDRYSHFTFTKAQAVVLPEGMSWREFWFKFWAAKRNDVSPEHVCERMATTVIQIWQEGE